MASDTTSTAPTTKKAPSKSILKKPKRPSAPATHTTQPTIPSTPSDDPSTRATAVKHATIIQHRKDTEVLITDNILSLLDLPTSAQPASAPTPSDTSTFLKLIHPFTPTDYDDLVAERNVYNQCGYALCPAQRRRFPGKGEWKLEAGGVARRADVERWCSRLCARRALYVRVQLGETQPWERDGGELELLEEKKDEGKVGVGDAPERQEKPKSKDAVAAEAQLAKEMDDLKVRDEIKAAKRAQVLALERGEDDGEKSGGLTMVDIKEKKVLMAPTEPSLDEASRDGKIEGYKAKFG